METEKSILIVEDEALIGLDIKLSLENYGYNVIGIASSEEEVLNFIEEAETDLVLMDIKLSGSPDGIEIADKLLEKYNIPVIFLTSYSDDETLERALNVSAYGYLLKPYNERELFTSIELAISRHKGEVAKNEAVRNDNKYKQLFLNLPDIFVLFKVVRNDQNEISDALIVDCNSQFHEFMNTEDIDEKNIANYISDDLLGLLKEKIEQILIEKKAVFKANLFGRDFKILGYTPEEDNVAFIITDISNLESLREQLPIKGELRQICMKIPFEDINLVYEYIGENPDKYDSLSDFIRKALKTHIYIFESGLFDDIKIQTMQANDYQFLVDEIEKIIEDKVFSKEGANKISKLLVKKDPNK